MYTKTIQNTKFVCILYAEIIQIKIFEDNEGTSNFLHTFKNSTNYTKLVQISD